MFIWLWCCGKCLAFLCAWRSCNSGVDESMVELEECSFGYGVVGNA